MRVLVTGSEGTLGAPLVKELRARGHEVMGCDLFHTPDPMYRRADVTEYRQMQTVFRDFAPNIVYHLAAEFGRLNGEHYYEQMWRTNVIGTRHVLELCYDTGTKMIFASSSEIYGESYEGRLYEELTQKNPPTQWNDYAISKWTSEMQIRHFIERYPAEVMVLRFFNSYGPGEKYHPYRSVIALFAYRLLNQMPVTVFEGYRRSFMFIDDFIPSLANATEKFARGDVVNLGGNEVRSVDDVVDIVLAHTGASPDLVTRKPKEDLNVRDKVAHNYKAKILLGHDPQTPLEVGIPKTIEWMRDYYKLSEPVHG